MATEFSVFSKLHEIDSKSEGPTYFLQQRDYKELEIEKQAEPWEEDPNLQPYLGQKVVAGGETASARLH
jgi:hypothetical protein